MPSWQPLVPGGGAQSALRLSSACQLAPPSSERITYLETQLTCGHTIPMDRDENADDEDHVDVVLSDMQFRPSDPLTRFAVGFAGAFQTVDGGGTWVRLLDMAALPGRPANCYYDWISDPANPALYIAFAGRSLVKIILT